MKALKIIGMVLLILVIVTAVAVGLACLFKAVGWFPSMTDWLRINIFDKLGLTFYSKI